MEMKLGWDKNSVPSNFHHAAGSHRPQQNADTGNNHDRTTGSSFTSHSGIQKVDGIVRHPDNEVKTGQNQENSQNNIIYSVHRQTRMIVKS